MKVVLNEQDLYWLAGIILIRNKIKIKNEYIKFKPVTFVIKRSSQLTWVEVVYHIDGTNLCLYDIETPFDPPEGIITFISIPIRIVLQPKPQHRPQRFPQIEGGGTGTIELNTEQEIKVTNCQWARTTIHLN